MKTHIVSWIVLFVFMALPLIIFFGCSDDDNDIINENLPALTTTGVTNITSNNATSGGNITHDGGAAVTARGVIWSTSADLNVNDNEGMTVDGAGAGAFGSSITGLEPETQYYVRAYATNSHGTGYGNALAFTTAGEDYNGDDNINYGDGVTDIDGNEYATVIIGNQEWMAENLRVTKYRNGDAIPTDLSRPEWQATTSGAYAPYSDAFSYGEIYGKLYNWYAVTDSRGLCPDGWREPSDDDWTLLVDYVVAQGYPNEYGDQNGAANALKSCRQIDSPLGGDCDTSEHPRWVEDDANIHHGFDKFGFSALPGGLCSDLGYVDVVGVFGYWWSATESSTSAVMSLHISPGSGSVDLGSTTLNHGFSVRCIKGASDQNNYNLNLSVSPAGSGTVTGNGQYAAGTQVNISANASTGWEFVNWTGNTEHLDNPNSESATVIMPAQNVSLNANFQQTETPGVVTQINEDFQGYDNYDPIDQNGWSTFAEEGSRVWICRMFQGNHYAQTTAFNSSDPNNVIWMITPPVNLDASTSPVLEFQSAHEYLTHNAVQLYISSDFDGNNPWNASWTMLNAQLASPSDDFHAWIDSGVISLGSHSGIVHIAWRYEGSHPNGTNGSFRVNNVLLYDAAK